MYLMATNPLSKWFFDTYLKFQQQEGERKSYDDFADYLKISRSYVTALINGKRTGISQELADQIFEITGDITIYDAASLPRPNPAVEILKPVLEEAEFTPEELEELKQHVEDFLTSHGYKRVK